MAQYLRIFCLLLICASFVSVEPRYTEKSDSETKPHHTSKPHHSKHQHAHKARSLSGGAGYPSGTQAPKTNQAHSYPSSHGKSGDRPVTSPPYRPPVQESISTQNRYTGSHAMPSNTWSGGSGYPAGTQPPKTGFQEHAYPNPATSPPAAYSLYPQSTLKPSHQYPSNSGSSGGSREAQKQAFLSSSYPSGLSSNGLLMRPSIPGMPGYQTSTNPPVPSYPSSNGGLSGVSNTSIRQTVPQSSSYPLGTGASGNFGTNTGNQGYGYANTQLNTSVSYPTNTGLSGGSSPTVQRANSSASYPSSNGLSGTGRIHHHRGVVHPSHGNKLSAVQTHSYPPSNGHNYPKHGTVYPKHGTVYPQATHINTGFNNHIYVRDHHHHTIIHHNDVQTTHIYRYRPPSHIYFVDNGMQNHYPVYKEELPAYVYEYKTSRSRFSTLLSGLALFNLGHLSKNHESHRYHSQYMPRPNEICKFIVRYDSLHQDEVDVDCRLMTDFIYTVHNNAHNSPKIQTGLDQILQPNGALAQDQQFGIQPLQNQSVIVDALDPRFNGAPLQIQPGMKCYMKYSDGFFVNTEKYVSCGLLEKYDKMSFNAANKFAPTFLMVVTTIALAILN